MTWLRVRMYLLVAALFGILYGALVGLGVWSGTGNAAVYLAIGLVFLGIQYLVSPSIIGLTMKIRWVTEAEQPELHQMVAELATEAGLPKPKVGISQITVPNAFAYGRTQRSGHVCVTQGLLGLLDKNELRAVLGHEISHIRHRDMAVMTLISAIPLILYWIAWSTMLGGMGNRRGAGGYGALIGLGAFLLYFLTNLLVLYGSRIRESYADMGSVQLGNQPQYLANGLYKLVNGDAARIKHADIQRVQAAKAFFVNDPIRSISEVRELSQIDSNHNGAIDEADLMVLRNKQIRLSFSQRIGELFMTHPNMLRRIKQLASLPG